MIIIWLIQRAAKCLDKIIGVFFGGGGGGWGAEMYILQSLPLHHRSAQHGMVTMYRLTFSQLLNCWESFLVHHPVSGRKKRFFKSIDQIRFKTYCVLCVIWQILTTVKNINTCNAQQKKLLCTHNFLGENWFFKSVIFLSW